MQCTKLPSFITKLIFVCIEKYERMIQKYQTFISEWYNYEWFLVNFFKFLYVYWNWKLYKKIWWGKTKEWRHYLSHENSIYYCFLWIRHHTKLFEDYLRYTKYCLNFSRSLSNMGDQNEKWMYKCHVQKPQITQDRMFEVSSAWGPVQLHFFNEKDHF
jgi:hypothetical protein